MIWKRAISFLTTALVILASVPVTAPAQAWIHGLASASASCPQATDNGCAAAPANGEFKNASLLTSAQQSGQNSLLPTRAGGALTLNIPAVDYGIGPDSTLTPQDPRTISDGVCTYSATGGPGSTPWVLCAGFGLITETLNNYDFCGSKIGKSAVPLYLGGPGGSQNPDIGSVVIITNSYFCIPASGSSLAPIGWGNVGNGKNWSIKFWNDHCDGASATSSSPFCLSDDTDQPGSYVDIRYSVFTNQGVGRIAGGVNYSTFTLRYSFIQGLNDLATTNHGELMERNCTGSRHNCTSSDDYEGNFIIWNPPPSPGLNNTTFFPSDGSSDGVVFTSVTVSNNIIVTNKGAGAITGTDVGLMTVNQVSSLGNVTETGNWLDAFGTGTGCNIIGDKSTQGSGITASQSGTVINITNLNGGFANNPIEPGWQFWRSGVRVATITSLGTSVGNTGTVNVDTSAIIGSDSAWTLVPGWTSLTQSGNYNLNDPSHTGTPTAMTISGPAMIASPCVQ